MNSFSRLIITDCSIWLMEHMEQFPNDSIPNRKGFFFFFWQSKTYSLLDSLLIMGSLSSYTPYTLVLDVFSVKRHCTEIKLENSAEFKLICCELSAVNFPMNLHYTYILTTNESNPKYFHSTRCNWSWMSK